MRKAVQEIKTCTKCNTEVREGALFCYGCGTDLSVTEQPTDSLESIVEENISQPTQKELEQMFEPKIAPIPKPEIAIESKESAGAPKKEKMPTAASIRDKAVKKQRVQKTYIWQENTESTIYFIVGAIIFIIVGVSLVFLGLYIR